MTASTVFEHPGLLAQALAEGTDDVVFAKDVDGRYRFANAAALRVMGRPAEEVLGHLDAEIMRDPQVARQLMERDREVLRSASAAELEEMVPLASGEPRYWRVRKMPLRGESGRIVGLLGIARDITEQRHEQALREAARLKLEMGIQAAGLVMAEIDYRSNQNHISAELARLLELGEGAMTVPRQAIFDRIHPEDRDRYLEGIARTVDPKGNGHLAIDVRALLPSGATRWLHIRLQVTFAPIDGQMRPDRGYCAARDVTTEMVAQKRLWAAQRMTEAVIEGAGALVYAKDLEGHYILSNQAWRTMHGLEADQAHGVTDRDLFGAETAAALRNNDRLVAETGEPLLVQERTLLHGHTAVFRSSKFPLYDESGRIYAVCGVSTDITDVLEADRRKDEFIATLAHELRNPLAPIRTGLEILRRVGELPAPAARTRDTMERQLTHMVRLVDDLLDVSRVSRGKLELRQEPLTIEQVLAHARETSEPGIDAAGHRLSVQLPGETLPVRGDLTRLAQVFSNLLNNACKYTEPGGHLQVRAWREGEQAVVEVRDDGAGMAPDMLPHVFEMFAQGGSGDRRAQGGLGIGLWLVRKLVELHGGSIRADSAGIGHGSTFTVRLPLLREAGDGR